MLLLSFCFVLFPKTVETWTDLPVRVMKDVSVIFKSAAFQWEAVALCIDLLCCNFEWWQNLRYTKRSQKKFFCSNFRSPKVQHKERWAVDVFRNWHAAREKNRILYSSREAYSKCAKSWKGLEDLHSLSLNFCLTKFVRTIERAFVQVSHSFANWFLNARVWISTHFRLHKTQAMMLF